PEVSWSALWSKVWYENYDEPKYVWQSTAANTDFEPKMSLSPLTFGTLKAAFYAMLLAAPLAVAAAIYTAYFMAPSLRCKVKPVIELMEAMPTVILGFFAGLFLAPYVE
ncbi:phosphate ABC transporter permease, partial [Bacillus sp. AFS076308]